MTKHTVPNYHFLLFYLFVRAVIEPLWYSFYAFFYFTVFMFVCFNLGCHSDDINRNELKQCLGKNHLCSTLFGIKLFLVCRRWAVNSIFFLIDYFELNCHLKSSFFVDRKNFTSYRWTQIRRSKEFIWAIILKEIK